MVTPHLQILCSEQVIVTEPDAVVLQPRAVWIEGGVIVRVSPLEALSSAPPEAVVHQLGDRVVAPAFVNAHTHLAMGALRGVTSAAARAGNVVTDLFFRLERQLTPEDVRAFTRMGAYECLLTGSAEVWDHYYFGEAVAEALIDVGLSGVVAPTLQDLSGPGADRWEQELAATERISRSERLARHGLRAALGPHATDTVSTRLFGQVVETAERLGVPVHLHVAQSFEEAAFVEAQHACSPVALLGRVGVLDLPRALLVHAVFASRSDLALLDPERHYVGVCPFSQLQFAVPTPVAALAEVGIPWVVGTDCVASNDSMNLSKELALLGGLSSLRAAFSAEARAHLDSGSLGSARALERQRCEALDEWSAEIAPARLLARAWADHGRLSPPGTQSVAGVIRAGAAANLVIYEPRHPSFWPGQDVLRTLAYADSAAAIWGMLVRGEWRGEAGDFHRSITSSGEYREAEAEATARKRALLERLENA